MAKQKLPIQWILTFALTPIVIIAFVVFMLNSGGGETASQAQHAQVTKAVRLDRRLKPDHTEAMSDGRLTVNEANAILKKANAMRGKK